MTSGTEHLCQRLSREAYTRRRRALKIEFDSAMTKKTKRRSACVSRQRLCGRPDAVFLAVGCLSPSRAPCSGGSNWRPAMACDSLCHSGCESLMLCLLIINLIGRLVETCGCDELRPQGCVSGPLLYTLITRRNLQSDICIHTYAHNGMFKGFMLHLHSCGNNIISYIHVNVFIDTHVYTHSCMHICIYCTVV